MIDIALLGEVSVSVAGVPLSGEAAQRRRVALLTLLVTPALRPVSRDRLIGWLWPDHDPDSARHLLSAALHVLRKALGADALLTNGDDVALSAAHVRSDVAAFREALAAGETERALALYRGDFMEGFFVNGAADFAQWVDGEREELRRLYGGELERAAQLRTEAGNGAAAVEAWRRRAALDPYDGRVALELMRALAAAGQRTAAIQHARVHAQLLEQEFGAAPDPQVEALAAALRQAPPNAQPAAVPAETASAVVPALASGDPPLAVPTAPTETAMTVAATVVVADPPAVTAATAIVHTSPPHSRRWRVRRILWRRIWPAVLVALVFTAVLLEGGREGNDDLVVGVRPFTSDDPALAALGAGLAEAVHSELPRIAGLHTVARDVGFRTVGMDSRAACDQMGSDYVMNVKLLQARDGLVGYLEVTNRAGVNKINERVEGLGITDLRHALVGRVAQRLGRKLRPESPSVLAADSADTAAVRQYTLGRTAWIQRTPASLLTALHHFEQATTIDPDYARAWVGLADALHLLGSYDYASLEPRKAFPLAERAARRALELEPSLADAYSALASVQANYHWNWEDAEANFRTALRGAGDGATISEWYALLLASRGRTAEARQHTVLAVQQQPTVPLPLVQQAHILYYAGEYEQARASVQEALALDSTFSRAHMLDALIDMVSGEEQRALAKFSAFRAMTQDPEPVLIALLGNALARTGQRAEARAQLQWLTQRQRRQYVPAELLAIIYVALGEHDAAFKQLERAYDERSNGLVYLSVEPLIAPIRADPRFTSLVERVQSSPSAAQ